MWFLLIKCCLSFHVVNLQFLESLLCSIYLDSGKVEQRKQRRMFWWDSGLHLKVYMWLNMEALTALMSLDIYQ